MKGRHVEFGYFLVVIVLTMLKSYFIISIGIGIIISSIIILLKIQELIFSKQSILGHIIGFLLLYIAVIIHNNYVGKLIIFSYDFLLIYSLMNVYLLARFEKQDIKKEKQ